MNGRYSDGEIIGCVTGSKKLWSVRCSNNLADFLICDLNLDTKKELVVLYRNGSIEMRSLSNGQILISALLPVQFLKMIKFQRETREGIFLFSMSGSVYVYDSWTLDEQTSLKQELESLKRRKAQLEQELLVLKPRTEQNDTYPENLRLSLSTEIRNGKMFLNIVLLEDQNWNICMVRLNGDNLATEQRNFPIQ